MKMITRRGLFLLVLVVAFLGGLGFLTYSFVSDGAKWAMQPYNYDLYYNGFDSSGNHYRFKRNRSCRNR